jgi:hypothetical protein
MKLRHTTSYIVAPEAGADTIVAEAQKQLDAWAAKQK